VAYALVAGSPGDTGAHVLVDSGSAGTILGVNSTVGDTVVAMIMVAHQTANLISGISSTIGTFVKLGSVIGTPGYNWEIWICWSATGAAKTVTVTTTGSYGWYAQGTEWSGNPTSAVFSTASGTSTAPAITLSPGTSGNIAIAAAMVPGSFSSGPGGAWTDYNAGVFVLGNGQDVAWQVTSSSSNVTATWACTSQAWVCVGVVLGSSATQITAALTPSASVAATNAEKVALTGNLTCQRVAPWRKRRNGLFIPDLVIPRLRIAI
jgi:hypothetical protein